MISCGAEVGYTILSLYIYYSYHLLLNTTVQTRVCHLWNKNSPGIMRNVCMHATIYILES